MTLTYASHPETKPADQTDAAGQRVETVGTTATSTRARAAVTLTYWTSNGKALMTADNGLNARDFASRPAAVKWLKKTLADASNAAKWYE